MESISWRGETPVSTRFDDPYYALSDGLAETRHVFLAGCGLPERFREGFVIAELGFGVGLNFLAAWRAWLDSGAPGPLRFVSFERWPPPRETVARALARWPELADLAEALCAQWSPQSGWFEVSLPGARLTLAVGDAREMLPTWGGAADAWFLDGFSPAKNPELWEADLLRAVFERTRPDGRCATYAAAGWVRRNLAAAGFEVSRRPGFGRKRHQSVGRRGTSFRDQT